MTEELLAIKRGWVEEMLSLQQEGVFIPRLILGAYERLREAEISRFQELSGREPEDPPCLRNLITEENEDMGDYFFEDYPEAIQDELVRGTDKVAEDEEAESEGD